MSVRVGLLGAGFIGRIHALNLSKDKRVDLVGVADVVPQAAQRATRHGVAAWEKLQKRLRRLAELNKEHILQQAREARNS